MAKSPPMGPADTALLEQLSARAPSENLPLMLALARNQAARRRPADVLRQHATDGFVVPSMLDQRLAHQLDALALAAAPDFEALLLSPLAPLGVCGAVAPSPQDRIVSAIRSTEVVSDPTNVLALECARRLARDPSQHVRLCTVHETVRAQKIPDKKGFSQHFRLFALVDAGPARADHGFEVDAFAELAALHLRLFDMAASLGCNFPDRRATLFVAPHRRAVADRLRARLAGVVPIEETELASNYYDGLRLLIGATGKHGEHVPLADIGLFDWMAKLTSNARLRFVASGVGIQLFPIVFR